MPVSKPRRRKIKITWKPSETAWGWAYIDDHRIELDPRMDDKTLIEVASHEVAHIILPDVSEEEIDLLGKQIADVLWRLKFRVSECVE